MSLYRAVYKCPLCGALLTTGKPVEATPEVLPELLSRFVKCQRFGSNPYFDPPPEQIAHKCADGGAGLAQFAGFQIVK